MKYLVNLGESRNRKRAIRKFAQKIGLLYFGMVDQRKDDYEIIRGFTVSSTHKDNSFCVGSSGGYDISIVDRKDIVWLPDQTNITQNWLIMTFRLKTEQDLPHFFINAINHDARAYSSFFQAFPAISQVTLGTLEEYLPDFTDKFAIYARPAMAIKVQQILPSKVATLFGNHFWPFSVEQNEHIIYIYASGLKISGSILEAMYQNGLWLADQIDYQAELV